MTIPKKLLPVLACWWMASGPARCQSSEGFDTANLIVTVSGKLGEAPAFGAGIVFAREKDAVYIATANHVVRGGNAEASDLEIRFKSSPNRGIAVKLLPRFDRGLDLAVMRADGLAASGVDICALRLDRLSDAAPQRGDDAYAVGNPNGIGWAMPVRPDKVSEISGDYVVFESVLIARGHSGGGLLNGSGALAGMVQADEPPYGRAIDIRRVLSAIKQWNYPVQLRMQWHYSEAGMSVDELPLINAVWHRDFDDTKSLLGQACTDVRAKDSNGNTALHFSDSREISQLLLDAGAEPNAKDKNGSTPLADAEYSGRTGIVDLLLTHGANVNATHQGQSLLSEACDWGAPLDLIKRLIAAGADVNARDTHGRTPIFHAVVVKEAQQRQLEEDDRKWEAQMRADPTIDSKAAAEAIRKSIRKYDPPAALDMVKLLIASGADVNARDDRDLSPLVVALSEREFGSPPVNDILDTLIRAGAKVDSKAIAAAMKDASELKILLDAGGTFTFTIGGGPGQKDVHPLLDDVDFGRGWANDRQVAAMLLAAGAKPGKFGLMQLFTATEWGWPEVVAGLAKAGVDINDESGAWTPLQTAVICGRTEVARILLDAGANPNIPGKEERGVTAPGSENSPLQLALGPTPDEFPVSVDASTRFDLVALLIAKHAKVTVDKEDAHRQPLWLALAGDLPPDLKSAALLIAHGANVNMVDRSGKSLLETAISRKRSGAVQLLLSAGAKPAQR